jgi:hypothetical protein
MVLSGHQRLRYSKFPFSCWNALDYYVKFWVLFLVLEFYSNNLEFGLDSPSTFLTTFCFCIYLRALNFDIVFLAQDSIFLNIIFGS